MSAIDWKKVAAARLKKIRLLEHRLAKVADTVDALVKREVLVGLHGACVPSDLTKGLAERIAQNAAAAVKGGR